eukprot:6202162-Pleurochrysis_carterae.AAC.2
MDKQDMRRRRRCAYDALLHLARRRLVVVEELADGLVERGPKLARLGVGRLGAQVLERHGERQVLAQRVPAQVALLDELLHVLGRRATGARLEEAAAGEERHDGEHLGRGAQLDDGEEVGQVVAQHVARHRDRVLAGARARAGRGDGLHRRHDRDVEAARVVLWQVGAHLQGCSGGQSRRCA